MSGQGQGQGQLGDVQAGDGYSCNQSDPNWWGNSIPPTSAQGFGYNQICVQQGNQASAVAQGQAESANVTTTQSLPSNATVDTNIPGSILPPGTAPAAPINWWRIALFSALGLGLVGGTWYLVRRHERRKAMAA